MSLHRLDSACFYYDKICAVKDTIKLHERTTGIDMLEIRYKYQDEIKLNRMNQKKQQMNLLLIIAGLIILIGIATTFFLLQRLKARKKQLENERLKSEKLVLQNEIEIKTREVTYKMLHITNQNQLINKVIDILTVKGSDPVAESPNIFNDIISELRLNQKLDLWDAFEKEFTQLHPDFFKNLLNDIPNLTQYEKRLCAFLKLNMNSKEIADILHLNYESILKARTRLRKKLNLTGTDENLNSVLGKY
ncbi:MAG: helix-turn-helix transcriptional regulator [Bacteroidetes bacterium]|nr:helix-turn-helix transcriptional regulator [Bacteroidota bacterium]